MANFLLPQKMDHHCKSLQSKLAFYNSDFSDSLSLLLSLLICLFLFLIEGPCVNNCVGIGNQKLFLLFIFYTALVCGYSLILVISRFASCALYDLDCANEVHFLMILFLFLESLLFLMFTLCMLGDQLSSMRSNQTSIDRLKNQKHEIKVDVNEVCGSTLDVNFHWHWLMPIAVSYSEAITEKILGYRICLSSPNNEEGTPLMEREEAKGVEMTVESARSKEVKTDVSQISTPPQVGGARVPAAGNEVKQVKIACKSLSSSLCITQLF